MDILKMFKKRFGNKDGYEKGIIYTEVLDNKVYKTSQNEVYRFKTRLDGGTETHSENLELLIPKIPFKYYLMTLDFYREVYTRHGTEACVLFYWNVNDVEIPADLLEKYGSGIIQDGKLIVIAPKQYASSGLSSIVEKEDVNGQRVEKLTEMVQWLEDNTVCILESHSHHSMSAFWSGTDDRNEQHSKIRMFSVFGKVMNEQQVKTRIYFLGNFYDLKKSDIFEFPTIGVKTFIGDEDCNYAIPNSEKEQLYTGPFNQCDSFPESWFELFTPQTRPAIYMNSTNKGANILAALNSGFHSNKRQENNISREYDWITEDEVEYSDEELKDMLEKVEVEGYIDEDYYSDVEEEDDEYVDEDEMYYRNKQGVAIPKKSIMDMTDEEFRNHLKNT